MKKSLIAFAAAATVATATIAVPTSADARCRGACVGAVGLGILGAAVVGSAIANAQTPGYGYRAYAPAPGYEPYRTYYVAAPVGCPDGYWARKPRHDRYGNFIGWSKPRFVCPY